MTVLGLKEKSHFIFHARIDTAICIYAYVYIILTPHEYYIALPASKPRLAASALYTVSFI